MSDDNRINQGEGRADRAGVLPRRRFVVRAGRAGAVLWLTPLLACGSRPRDADADPEGDTDANTDRARPADAGPVDTSTTGDRDAASLDGAVPADAGLDAASPDAKGCASLLTPISDFPVLFGGRGTVPDWKRPELAESTYRLSISGLVQTPLELSLAELEADSESQVTVLRTLQCVYGARGTALWTGTPLRVLLDRSGIDRSAARRLVFTGADGFSNNLRLEDIYGDAPDEPRFEPLLAFAIHGERLPEEMGFPLRLLLPDRYGFKNIKWLTDIQVTADDSEVGHYQELGFDDAGVVGTNVLYTGGRQRQLAAAGQLTLCGHALSGHGAITTVEISIDDAPFVEARLEPLDQLREREPAVGDALQVQAGWPFPFVGVAVLWEYEWAATPGEHTIALQAIDASGRRADGFLATVIVQA